MTPKSIGLRAPSQARLEDRVILKTIDGRVVVRPPAPEMLVVGELGYSLTSAGKAAWNRGEPVGQLGHWGTMLDLSARTVRAMSLIVKNDLKYDVCQDAKL